MIEAKVIEYSKTRAGKEIITFQLKYPRFIHAEFMTHRMFSRNASSSRAIPVEKMIQSIETDWAKPLSFHKNQKGMQGGEELSLAEQNSAFRIWKDAKDNAVSAALRFVALGVHKQYANRVLEPFSFISVVCTTTEINNFYALRHHSMAQPEIRVLAEKMYEAQQAETPKLLADGHWHLPYVTYKDWNDLYNTYIEPSSEFCYRELLPRSVARCARVSYNNHDGTESSAKQDQALFDRLLGSMPIHASPAEHQAMATSDSNIQSGNFRGWIQYRKTLPNENITDFEVGKYE